jgi:sialate O-acetylesterase
VVTLKHGEVDDIHPRDKKPVGELAARAAAARINQDGSYLLPAVQDCRREQNILYVTFNAPVTVDDGKAPAALMIAGKDEVYYPAQVEICSGNTLKLSAPEVREPYRVRYAWSDNPQMANLCGVDGLPVSPFEFAN